MIFWEIVFILAGIVCVLASVFNWEWYFRLTYKSRFWDDRIGRGAHRILNAVICVLIMAGAIYLLING